MKDNKKAWLCYMVGSCEQGSEGWSSMLYPVVCYGNTDEEILDDYRTKLHTLLGKDIIGEISYGSDGSVYSHYPIHKVFLPRDIYGDVKDYSISLVYRKHDVSHDNYQATVGETHTGGAIRIKKEKQMNCAAVICVSGIPDDEVCIPNHVSGKKVILYSNLCCEKGIEVTVNNHIDILPAYLTLHGCIMSYNTAAELGIDVGFDTVCWIDKEEEE